MKKKKAYAKILAMVLTLSLTLTMFSGVSTFAQEASDKEQLTEKGELWQVEENTTVLNCEGDLSLEKLKTAKLAEEDKPEIVSQESIDENGHVNRLWAQEEDLNSIVFQNRDGTKTVYRYSYPVKYKDASGKIKDKSNKISQTADGDYTNADNDINTYFPKKLNRNKGVELKFDDYVVEMAPDIKGNSGASRQAGHNKYSDPTEYVQYPNVFDEGISLRYTPTFEGYKEDIVLNEYTGINEFSFRLYTDGLSLVLNEDGSYCLIDPLSGEIKTQIGDLVVYDSKPFDDVDESASNEKIYSHRYQVETIKQDSEYYITVVVDKKYLTDSERVYPVYVDPTLCIDASSSDGTKAILDAPIYSGRPSSAHGSNDLNVVGKVGWWDGEYFGTGRTLMKFPGLINDSTYNGLYADQITSLELHIYEGSGNTNNARIDLWQYTGTDWTEYTARCNNVGWDSYSNNFNFESIDSSGWQTFELTGMVLTWKSSAEALNNGIMITNKTSESNAAYSKHFLSTDAEDLQLRPYLRYTYAAFVLPTTSTPGITHDAVYRIKNVFSSCNMGVPSGTVVKQYSADECEATQLWQISYQNNGYYKLKSAIMPDKVLTLTNDGVVLAKNCNLQCQLWSIKKVADDQYRIVNKTDTTNNLQIVGDSCLTEQNIISSNSTISGKWTFEELFYERWSYSNYSNGSFCPESGLFVAKFYQENNKWKLKTTVFFQLDQYNVNAIKDYMNHTNNFITRNKRAQGFKGDTCWGLDLSLERTLNDANIDCDDFNAINVETNLPNYLTDIEKNSGNYNDETDAVAKSLPTAGTYYYYEVTWEDMRNGEENDKGSVVLSFEISGLGYMAPWPSQDHEDYNRICGVNSNVVEFTYGVTRGQK